MLTVSTLEIRRSSKRTSSYNPRSMAFDPASNYLITSHNDGLLSWLDLSQRSVVADLQVGPYGLTELCVLPYQRSCIGVSGSEHAMYLINLDQPGIRRVDHFVEGPCCPLPDPMSDTIFVAGLSRERDLVYMIDGATGAVRNQAKIGQLAIEMVIDPHLQLLFVVNNRTPSLPIIKTTTGALLHTVSLPATPSGLAADLVSGQLFVSTLAGLSILRSPDGSLITQLNAEYIYGVPVGGLANLGGIGFDAEAQRVVLGYRPSHTGPSSLTILDSGSHAIVARHTLLGRVMAVRMHLSKHHTYVLSQTRDYAVPRETRVLTLQILDTRTGTMLHEEVVGKHPLDVLLVESRNQLFIADFDEQAVVCVEDLLP